MATAFSYNSTSPKNSDGYAFNVEQLRTEIEADGGITTSLDFIHGTSQEDVTVHFVTDLGAGEITALDALVAAHVPSDFIFNAQGSIYDADQLLSPISSGWAISEVAPLISDVSGGDIILRVFDDTEEEGIGIRIQVPSVANYLTIRFKSKAITAPGAARMVGINLYTKEIAENVAIGSWSSATQMSDIDIPTNTNILYDEETFALSDLNMSSDTIYLLEITRTTPSSGTNLEGDWGLLTLEILFS